MWPHTAETLLAIVLPVLERQKGPAQCQAGEGWFFWTVFLQSSSSTNTQTCKGAREGLRIEREMRQASGNFPFHWGTQEHVLFSAPLANMDNMTLPTYARLPAGRFSACLSASIWSNLPHSTPPTPFLAWCLLIPHYSVGERVIPSARKGPTSLMLQCKRLHSEEQVVSLPISALDGLYTVLFCLKLGNAMLLAIRGALLLNHQILWLNIKLSFSLSKHRWSWMESCLGCGLMNQNPKI